MRGFGRDWLLAALVTVAATASLAAPGVAGAADIRVILSNAVKEPLEEIVPAFEKQTSHKVVLVGAGTEAAMKRVNDGEAFDIVLIGSDRLEDLLKAGKLVAGTRRDFARSGVGVAVRAGLAKPSIATAENVKQAILQARKIAYSTGPSGLYVESLFAKLGVAEEIKGRLLKTPSGVQVADVLARGDADLGFQQVSELVHAKGIEFLGPLPAAIQNTTIFAGAVHAGSKSPDAARAFLQFIVGPGSANALRHHGMEPG